jgi:DNA replication protein DnaC
MTCELCDGTGWTHVEIGGVRRATRCECWREALGRKLLAAAQIPAQYRRCDLDNFRDYNDSLVRAVRMARALAQQFPVVDKGLLLLGPPGVGKTHLAVAALKLTIELKRARGLFCDTRRLLSVIRSTYNPTERRDESEVLGPVMQAELLVLDDLGAERPTEWVEEMMNLIINTRYNEKRLTIFTSNYPERQPPDSHGESLEERIGFRIFSRLFEMCEFVQMHGVHFRELGRDPTGEEIARLDRKARNVKEPSGRRKATAKARLPEAPLGLKWPGGRAGS